MITTLLDNDMYQFTMAQAIWAHGHDNYQVRYEFRNRTFAVPLASRIDLMALRDQIDAVRQLTFTIAEIAFLRDTGLFEEGFLSYLTEEFKLPEVEVSSNNDHLVMRYEGDWAKAIFWETPLLALVNEMYFERFGDFTSEGFLRLGEKIAYLQDRKTLKFVEFGTRRRFSRKWQRQVTGMMQDAVPNLLLGTSNVHLAKWLGLKPIGTMAHQLFMVYTALHTQDESRDPIAAGASQVLREWAHTYGAHPNMMTALPDTYTTRAFFQKVTPDDLAGYTGFRQDSGNPIEIGRKLESFSKLLGSPRIIFSDSLDVRRMSVIEDEFPNVDMVSGWGTNLTNDLGYEPISIVIKPCAVKSLSNRDWIPCVKLSDDVQKATGDQAEIHKYLTSWWGPRA